MEIKAAVIITGQSDTQHLTPLRSDPEKLMLGNVTLNKSELPKYVDTLRKALVQMGYMTE